MDTQRTAAAGRIQRRRGLVKNAAAVVGHHQGDGVEHMDRGADVEGRVGGVSWRTIRAKKSEPYTR